MNDWLLSICRLIEKSSGSIALHESLYLYPLIETTHVLAICLFVGTIFMLDLRLLGWSFTTISVEKICKNVIPFSLIGFTVMVVTGALLFYAIPVRTYQSIFFRIKMALFIVAGVNAIIFHLKARKVSYNFNLSRLTKVAAIISLFSWGGVIITGRMIAYNWFDCDKSDLNKTLHWLAGCDDFS